MLFKLCNDIQNLRPFQADSKNITIISIKRTWLVYPRTSAGIVYVVNTCVTELN